MNQLDEAKDYETLTESFMMMIRKCNTPGQVGKAIARFPVELHEELLGIAIVEDLLLDVEAMGPGLVQPDANDVFPFDGLREIANYTILREIGRGGMGIVYEATQDCLERTVAIKVLAKRSDQRNFEERFRLEAKTASRLHHPSVVSVFDYGIDNGNAWLAMPFIEGVTLNEVIAVGRNASGPVTNQYANVAKCIPKDADTFYLWAARLAAQLSSALQYAHEAGVVHRDIKPGNLLLDAKGNAWIADFGLAKICEENLNLSKTGDMIGTPRYMAPEQVRGIADERSDVYSLGVTTWELVTGKRAWGDLSTCDLLTTRWTVELPEARTINPEVPEGLSRIIARCCTYHPEDRYQTMTELKHVLNRFGHGEEIGDRRATRRDEVARPYLRKRFLAMAMAIAGIAGFFIAGLAGWGAINNKSEAPVGETEPEAKTSNWAIGQLEKNVHFDPGNVRLAIRDAEAPILMPGLAHALQPQSVKIVGGVDQDQFIESPIFDYLMLTDRAIEALPKKSSFNIQIELSEGFEFEGFLLQSSGNDWKILKLVQDCFLSKDQLVNSTSRPGTRLERPLAMCSADGTKLYHAHRGSCDQIEIWQSDLSSKGPYIRNTRLLSAISGLPKGIEEMATFDGETFYVFSKQTIEENQDSRMLNVMEMGMDGKFSVVSDPVTLSIDHSIRTALMTTEKTIMLLTSKEEDFAAWQLDLNSGRCRPVMAPAHNADANYTAGAIWEVPGMVGSQVTVNLAVDVIAEDEWPVPDRSPLDGTPADLEIQNDSEQVLQLMWIDHLSIRQNFGAIQPGTIKQVSSTYSGHVWEIYGEDGNLWHTFQVEKGHDDSKHLLLIKEPMIHLRAKKDQLKQEARTANPPGPEFGSVVHRTNDLDCSNSSIHSE